MWTEPSSSMLISAPVSATMPLIVLPPGPISAPIFSGLILIVSIRGACFFRPLNRLGQDFVADAGQFQVELITGDAIVGSTEFEIHVTEMVFRTNDIGEQFVALQLSIFAVLGD